LTEGGSTVDLPGLLPASAQHARPEGMTERILWGLFLFTCIFAFFFGYGIVENLIRKWTRGRQIRRQKAAPRIFDNCPALKGN